MALTTTQVSQLYVALFGRASEGEGNKNWVNHDKNMIDTAALMLDTDAAKNYFGEAGQTNNGFVKVIYENTLGFINEAEIAAWAANLDNGMSRAELVTLLLEEALSSKYAGSAPQNQLLNRIEVSDYMANNVETVAAENVESTQFLSVAHPNGKLNVTDDKSTVSSAESAIDEMSGGAVIDGKTFSLTTGVDTFVGTDKADLFNASLLTVNDGDTLDGGAGKDKLNMELNANVTDKFKSSNIEQINVTSFGDKSVDMKNITGVETVTTKGSTGILALNNIATSTVGFGFDGSSTNKINASHVAGALSGSSDALNVNLNGAKAVELVVAAGFESAKITTAGTSDITKLTAPGVTTYTVEGTGSVNFNDQLVNVTTVSATSNTGAITTGTVIATTGFVDKAITSSTDGASVILGAGNDNIGFTNTSLATKSSTVKLGAGDDKLVLNAGTTGSTYVFGEAGDDSVRVDTNPLRVTDLIDLGAGNDTLTLNVATANTMVLRGVENLTLTNTAVGLNVVNSADSALKVTIEAGAVAATAAKITGLTAGSTVTVNDSKDVITGVADLTVGYKSLEAAATIDVNSVKAAGAVAITNVTAATIDYAKAADSAAGHITGAETKSFTINGADSVSTGNIVSAINETVSATATKGLTVGTIGATSTKLSTVNLTSTTDAVTAGTIGKTDNAETLNVTINANKAILQTGIIDSTKVGNISATSTTGAVSVGATATIGANATTMGDLTINAKTDAKATVIGDKTKLATLGTVSMTATDGAIALTSVSAKDSTGINVNMTAKTFIDTKGDGVASQAIAVTNVGGNITASLAGAAKAQVNYTAETKGAVNLTATNTGGLKSVITNAGTIADALTSTVSLGNATTTPVASNDVEFAGTVATLNVTGGTGSDNITLSGQVKSGTIALGTGTDSVIFTGIDGAAGNAGTAATGVVINLGSTAYTVDAGTSTTVAAGHAVEYNAAGTGAAKIVSGGFDLTLSGVESVVGTAGADIIIANGEGNGTIKGGAGADTIVLGAGKDTVILSETVTADVIKNFNVTDDTIQLSKAIYTALGAEGALTAAQFLSVSGGVATDANQRIIVDSDNGNVYYDADGNTATAAVLIGTVTDANGVAAVLTVADFVIIA